MRQTIKNRIDEYLSKLVFENTKDNVEDIKNIRVQDLVPPFYKPGIMLP